ncbi:MAG: gliding motility-associated C-terminal domain-containing protein, partial [Bacteroidia bacterium]|nr:gliding motility-associated C-terminal domain-containing protein [Bacteroidia bacterium]
LSNAFSPNGDGKNDLFLKGLDLTIFNRWGQILFTGNQGWDGKYNGSDVNAGTYYYTVKVKKSGSKELVEKTGALTLLTN